MAYLCYVLVSTVSPRTYVGITNNLPRRLRQHNGEIQGGAKYTRGHRPWRLKYVAQSFPNKSEAMKFEWKVKHYSKRHRGSAPIRRRWLALTEAIEAGSRDQPTNLLDLDALHSGPDPTPTRRTETPT